MLRALVILALWLTALLSLTNTWALQNATVSSKFSVPVVATGNALLALAPGAGAGNAAQTAYLSGGQLLLDFRKGGLFHTPDYGFATRPVGAMYADSYRYKGLFTVQNNGEESQCISIYVPDGTGPNDLAGIYVRPSTAPASAPMQVAGHRGSNASPSQCRPLGKGQTFLVDFHWEIRSTEPAPNLSFQVVVQGTR